MKKAVFVSLFLCAVMAVISVACAVSYRASDVRHDAAIGKRASVVSVPDSSNISIDNSK